MDEHPVRWPISLRYREPDYLTYDHVVGGVRQFEKDLVRPWSEPHDNHRFAGRIDEMPRRIVYRDVNVSDPRRHVQGSGAEHRQHTQVFRPVLDEDPSCFERPDKRRIDDQPWRRFFTEDEQWRWAANVAGRIGFRSCRSDGALASISDDGSMINLLARCEANVAWFAFTPGGASKRPAPLMCYV